MKSLIVKFWASFFLFFLFFDSVLADSPRVYITDFEVTPTSLSAGEILRGRLTFWNVSDVAILDGSFKVVLLGKDKVGAFFIVDERIDQEVLVIRPDEKITKEFSYTLPANILSGEYVLGVEITSQKGIPLSRSQVALEISGNGQLLYINSGSVIKNGQEFFPGEGIGFSPDERPTLKFNVHNFSKDSILARPKVEIFERQTNMGKVEEVWGGLLTFPPFAIRTLEITMPALTTPESYLAVLKFYDQDNLSVSNLFLFRWVVTGESSEVVNIGSDKTIYNAGEKAKISIDYVGPADGSDVGQGELVISLNDKEGNLCGSSMLEVPLNAQGGSVEVEVEINHPCFGPQISARIEKNGRILDEYQVDLSLLVGPTPPPILTVPRVTPPPASSSQSEILYKGLYALLGTAWLIILGILIRLLKGRVFVLFFLLGIAVSWVFAPEVEAKATLHWYEPVRDSSYWPGDPITFRGKTHADYCFDEYNERYLWFSVCDGKKSNCVLLGTKVYPITRAYVPWESYNETYSFPPGFCGYVYAKVRFRGYHRPSNTWEEIIAYERIIALCPTPTPTPTVSPTPTPTSTPTPSPSPTPTISPTPLPSPAPGWFQTEGGDVHSNYTSTVGESVFSDIPDSAENPLFSLNSDEGHKCNPYIALSISGIVSGSNTDMSFGSGSVSTKGWRIDSYSGQLYTGTPLPRYDYNYFHNTLGLGAKAGDCPLGPASGIFKCDSGLEIDSDWNLTSDQNMIIFVEGDLNINAEINVPKGGFLAFIVKDNININGSVGGEIDESDGIDEDEVFIDGVFIADGKIFTGDSDKRLIVSGTFVSYDGFELQRDLEEDNNTTPAEMFLYRPDFVVSAPGELKKSSIVWEEIAP